MRSSLPRKPGERLSERWPSARKQDAPQPEGGAVMRDKNEKLAIARKLYLEGAKTQDIQRRTNLGWRELQRNRRRDLGLGGRRAPNEWTASNVV